MSKQEKRRLERLKKELDNQQKKLDADKKKFADEKKAHREAKTKLERQQKQLQQKVRKFQLNQVGSPLSPGGTQRKSRMGGNSKQAADLAKANQELSANKKELEKAKKSIREYKKDIVEKEALIKSLKRQLKNAGKGKKEVGNDKIVKQLKREIANLKKRLKLALRDLDKQARYYQQQLKRFKQDQQKWINRQREISKNKGVIIKYAFIDDIRKIKKYRKGKNRIKIVTRDGGEVIVKDVQIIDATEVEEAADDVIDEVQEELDNAFKEKRKRKRKKTGNEEDEEKEPEKLEDIADDDDEFEDHTDEIYAELMEELSHRTKDLHTINEIYCNEEDDDAMKDKQFKELWESVIERHNKWTSKLSEQLNYDLSDELPELNKNWQDEIYKVKDSVIIIRRRARKKGKKEGIEEAKSSNDYAMSSTKDENEAKALDEVKYLSVAKDQMIYELNGRISDLTQLNAIYFHPEENASILSKEQQVNELVNNVEHRHEAIINELSELPPSENAIDDLLPENNELWKSLIYETGKEMDQNDAEPLRLELVSRTKDLDKAVKVLNGDEDVSALNELVDGIYDRTNKLKNLKNYDNAPKTKQQEERENDQDEWLQIMSKLKTANQELQNQIEDAKAEADAAKAAAKKASDKEPAQDFGPVAQAQKLVIDQLLNEMDDRRQDLNNLSNLNKMNTENAVEEAEKLRADAIKRHKAQNEKLAQKVRAFSVVAKQNGGDDKEIQDALKLIENDNAKWANQLNKLVDDTKNVDDLKKRNNAAMEELNGRIADVLKMKQVFETSNDKNNDSSRADAENQFESLQQSVKDRHEGVEQRMASAIDKSKKEDRKQLKEMEENDGDWRDAIFNTASHITGLNEPEPEPEPEIEEPFSPDVVVVKEEVKEEEEVEALPVAKELKHRKQKSAIKVTIYKKAADAQWWLDKDDARKAHIDTITVDKEQQDDIYEVAKYCDRVLYHPNTGDMGVATDLYFPIPENDNHHILSTFYDGTMLCDLINRIDPDYVDKRVINYPDPFDPYPLSDKLVLENASLMLSAARSIGVEMTSYDARDWMDPTKHTAMLIELVNGLAQQLLSANMNLVKKPELCRLIKDNEDPTVVENLSGQEWLSRWMNQNNGNALGQEIKNNDWNNSTFGTMANLSPTFKQSASVKSFDENAGKASNDMVNHIYDKAKNGTTIKPADLSDDKASKIHKYFSLEAYAVKSGLSPLSSQEQDKYSKYLKKAVRDDEDTFVHWINAMLPHHLHVEALIRDLSDGVVLLKLLEKGKPGCVNWKKAREKVRHKFDKLNNCNTVMSLAQAEPFGFRLVGMGGNDIVDGNQKFLSTLLWQLMRYFAVKQISDLSFGGKQVTDADILQWANVTINQFEDRKSKPIGNFKDRTLSTCVFYIELLAAVKPNDVDTSLIHYDVRPLVNNRVNDNKRRERIDNARLAMSYARKFGSDLFVLPEHLCGMEPKAVLSMFAAVMTVGMAQK